MLHKRAKFTLAFLIIGSILMQGCEKTDDTYRNSVPVNKVDVNMYDYLNNSAETFDTLIHIVNAANLADTLKNSNVTFFVPTDKSIRTALENLNTNRATANLPALNIDDVPGFVWRMMLMRYLIPGKFTSEKFALADGLDVTTINGRRLHVNAVPTTTQGSVGSGSLSLKYSDMSGSRFTKDWVFSYVTTSNLQTTNGILNILEPSHVFGFKSFVQYASTLQNLYSDRYYIAAGTIVFANATTRRFLELAKDVKAIDQTTVEVDVADLKSSNYYMRLKVNPDNNTVIITPAPTSTMQIISNEGTCYYDPINLEFVLNYKYGTATSINKVSERIKLRNF